jgi:two-component system, NtrC family, sensor kinase
MRPARVITIKLSLFWKFSIAVVFIVLIFGSINTYLIVNNVQNALENEIQKRGFYIARSISDQVVEGYLYEDIIALQKVLDNAAALDSGILYVMILDGNNSVVAKNFEKSIPQNVIEANIIDDSVNKQLTVLNPVDMPGIKILDFAVPIIKSNVGTVRIGLIDDWVAEDTRKALMVFWKMVALFLILGILGALLFSYFISYQLKSILQVAEELDLKTLHNHQVKKYRGVNVFITKYIAIRINDEIDQLGMKFNEMIRRLRKSAIETDFAQKSMVQSEKLATVGIIAAGLAHELNNPLAGIQGGLLRLKKHKLDEDKRHKYLTMMLEASKRIETVVKRLLNFSRKHEYVFTTIRVEDSIESALLLVAYQLESNRISIIKDISFKNTYISGSSNHLVQVFVNLFLNSIDAIFDQVAIQPNHDRVISIDVRKDEDLLTILIDDTGTGIKSEESDAIFEPLYTTKKVGKGTGLGLAVCFNIIQAHKGKISAFTNSNKGATIKIQLPIIEHA